MPHHIEPYGKKLSMKIIVISYLEDDCLTHPKVIDFINANLAKLQNADICFFGINTDSILHSISPTGLVSLSIFTPKYPSEEWIRNALSKTSIKEVAMHRLIKPLATALISYLHVAQRN